MLLDVKFKETDHTFVASFGKFNQTFGADFGKVIEIVRDANIEDLPKYSGAFEVTPSAKEEQVLKTAQKYVSEDITVHKIPYAEVTNIYNGETVTIG